MLDNEDINLLLEALNFFKAKNSLINTITQILKGTNVDLTNPLAIDSFNKEKNISIKEAFQLDMENDKRIIIVQSKLLQLQDKLLDKKGTLTADDLLHP